MSISAKTLSAAGWGILGAVPAEYAAKRSPRSRLTRASGRAPFHENGRDEGPGRKESTTGLILIFREGGIAEDPPFSFDSAILYLPQPALPPHPLAPCPSCPILPIL
jgi:hypothetical protein